MIVDLRCKNDVCMVCMVGFARLLQAMHCVGDNPTCSTHAPAMIDSDKIEKGSNEQAMSNVKNREITDEMT